MPIYNKLVRDNIPSILEQSGKDYRYKTLNDSDYVKELNKKLHEELEEYLAAVDAKSAIEELADILELIHAITKAKGFSFDELEKVRNAKALRNGAFEKKLFLIDVYDNSNGK